MTIQTTSRLATVLLCAALWAAPAAAQSTDTIRAHAPVVHFQTEYKEGQVAVRGQHRLGRKHGEWQHFYADGTPKAIERFVDGARVGLWKTFHPNGRLHRVGQYQAGVPHGIWMVLAAEGTVTAAFRYAHSEIEAKWHVADGLPMPWDLQAQVASTLRVARQATTAIVR